MSHLIGALLPHSSAPPPPPPPATPPTIANASQAGAATRAAAAAAAGSGFDNTLGTSSQGASAPSTAGGKSTLGDK